MSASSAPGSRNPKSGRTARRSVCPASAKGSRSNAPGAPPHVPARRPGVPGSASTPPNGAPEAARAGAASLVAMSSTAEAGLHPPDGSTPDSRPSTDRPSTRRPATVTCVSRCPASRRLAIACAAWSDAVRPNRASHALGSSDSRTITPVATPSSITALTAFDSLRVSVRSPVTCSAGSTGTSTVRSRPPASIVNVPETGV